MAFSDLCHIGNAYQTVENETDQSENIMDDSFVRDLIVNLLEEGPPSDNSSSVPPQENTLSIPPNQYRDTGTSLLPPYNYQTPINFNHLNDQNGFNYSMQNGLQNGYGNGFVTYPENDVNTLLGVDLPDTTETVSPEQLNLLRLAAQEIGGAQFQSPNGSYNFFEPNQRNSLPETNMFPNNNFNRPSSLNLDMNYNNFDAPYNNQRFPNNFKENQDPSEILSYLTQLNLSLDRTREENGINNIDFNKMPEMNGHYEDFKAIDERNKMNQFFNRNFQQQNRPNDNHFFDNMITDTNRPPPNFDFANQTPVSSANNFKPPNGLNGFHQDFMRNNQMPNFPNDQRNFENRENMQQMTLMRQQELARQMSLFMRNRPPPNQLNVDVSYLHDNNPFGVGTLLGPSPPHAPPVLPSPGIDMPLLAPFYAMRNIRNAATSSGVLHARLDMCYEQWRQLERERKRTEARLALAYPGRAVSSSNSIPVPRLPPCPTRVDRLTVDMLREHTKVLTLMGKMETLRAGVCAGARARDKGKITVLKRGQDDVKATSDPADFQPASWREDVKHLSEIAPHKEVESAMLNWRNAVANVQAARKRELHTTHHGRPAPNDPILALAEAVKTLCVCARRARAAMWCDLTLTVALAPHHNDTQTETVANTPQTTPVKQATPENAASVAPKPAAAETKEETPTTETASPPAAPTKPPTKLTDKEKRDRRQANYKKHVQRNDFYRNQRYDARFMQSRHPYYLATGPIN